MKILFLNRKVHYWGSIIIALPFLIVIATGILLLLKKDVNWIQPATQKGVGTIPTITFDNMLSSLKADPTTGVSDWSDVVRIDIQPSKGIAKITAQNDYETQLDTQSGAVLQVAKRRSDLIESIHDGSFFHDSAKYWYSLPLAIILFISLLTGVVLFFQPYYVKYKKKRKIIKKRALPTH